MPETQEMTLPVVDLARENDEVRKVLWTGGEVHQGHDQLLYFVAGTDMVRSGDVETDIANGDVGIVPSGVFHNARNTGSGMLKLSTTYRLPEHDPNQPYIPD